MQQNSLLLEQSDLAQYQQQNDLEIVQLQSAMRYKTIKNNLQFIMILNFICLIGNTFAMSFYQWFLIVPKIDEKSPRIWLNLLYVYDKDSEKYMSFNTYEKSNWNFCNFTTDVAKQQCLNELSILKTVGKCCFACTIISLVFLGYDIIRLKHLLYSFQKQIKYESKIKGVLVYTIIITCQSLSLVIYFITTLILKSLRDIQSHFGACYWVSWFCCISLMIFACYYRKSKGRFQRFQIMEKLINQELSEESINISLQVPDI